MENNDFDIFDLLRLFVKQKKQLALFAILFFVLSFTYLFTRPVQYKQNFHVSSVVLSQNEILLSLQNLKDLIEYKEVESLQAIILTKEDVESIAYFDVRAMKNALDIVEVQFSSSNENVVKNLQATISSYFNNQEVYAQWQTLKESQLKENLKILESQLDSTQNFSLNAMTVVLDNKDYVALMEKKNKVEKELNNYSLIHFYGDKAVLIDKPSLLKQLVSAVMLGLALSIVTVCVLYFSKKIFQKI